MVSGFIGNEVPRKGLRVRFPCPPLKENAESDQRAWHFFFARVDKVIGLSLRQAVDRESDYKLAPLIKSAGDFDRSPVSLRNRSTYTKAKSGAAHWCISPAIAIPAIKSLKQFGQLIGGDANPRIPNDQLNLRLISVCFFEFNFYSSMFGCKFQRIVDEVVEDLTQMQTISLNVNVWFNSNFVSNRLRLSDRLKHVTRLSS